MFPSPSGERPSIPFGEREAVPNEKVESVVAEFNRDLGRHVGEVITLIYKGYGWKDFKFTTTSREGDWETNSLLTVGILHSESTVVTKAKSISGSFIAPVENTMTYDLGGVEGRRILSTGQRFIQGNYMFGKLEGGRGVEDLVLRDFEPDKPAGIGFRTFPEGTRRMEVYIGNHKALPVLANELFGWEYMQLGRILGIEVPMDLPGLSKKVEREQLDWCDSLNIAEKEWAERDEAFKIALKFVGHDPMMDEATIKLTMGSTCERYREKVEHIVGIGLRRGYNDGMGVTVERSVSPGIKEIIDISKVAKTRAQLYSVSV